MPIALGTVEANQPQSPDNKGDLYKLDEVAHDGSRI
jgi:hypothetical protein